MNFDYGKYLEFLYGDTVYLMKPTSERIGYDNVKKWEHVGELKVSLQSYSGGLAEKEYGLLLKCQKRLFTLSNENITEGLGIALGPSAVVPDFTIIYAVHDKGHVMALLEGR